MRDDLGLKTIIDLRTKSVYSQTLFSPSKRHPNSGNRSEHMKQAKKHDAKLAAAAAHAGSDTAAVLPLRMDGLEYHEVKVSGRQFEKHLLRQLSWWSYLCVDLY